MLSETFMPDIFYRKFILYYNPVFMYVCNLTLETRPLLMVAEGGRWKDIIKLQNDIRLQ